MIFKEVRHNKTKTAFIIGLFFAFIALFAYFLALWIGGSADEALIIAFIVSALMSVFSYYNSDKMVLSLNKARDATKNEYLQLNTSLEALCIGAGIPVPKLYVIDDNS